MTLCIRTRLFIASFACRGMTMSSTVSPMDDVTNVVTPWNQDYNQQCSTYFGIRTNSTAQSCFPSLLIAISVP